MILAGGKTTSPIKTKPTTTTKTTTTIKILDGTNKTGGEINNAADAFHKARDYENSNNADSGSVESQSPSSGESNEDQYDIESTYRSGTILKDTVVTKTREEAQSDSIYLKNSNNPLAMIEIIPVGN